MSRVHLEVEALKQEIARDFPEILKENLVGIYLWGSLTYDAFEEEASDIDCVVVLPNMGIDGPIHTGVSFARNGY